MHTADRLYRGRVCNERPNTTDDISYPKPDKVKRLGRASRDGKSVFYCCLGAFPVFLEVRAREGDLIALSEWAVTEPIWMHNLGYHPDALDRIGAPVLLQRSPLINPIPHETNRNFRIRRRMSLAFTADVPDGEEHRYKETIAINELLFDRASRFPFAAWAAREAGKLQVPCTRQCAYEDLRTTLRCGPNSLTGA